MTEKDIADLLTVEMIEACDMAFDTNYGYRTAMEKALACFIGSGPSSGYWAGRG